MLKWFSWSKSFHSLWNCPCYSKLLRENFQIINFCLFRANMFSRSPGLTLFPRGGGGQYCPPYDILPDNSKLARAEGPGFWDFFFNLVLHVPENFAAFPLSSEKLWQLCPTESEKSLYKCRKSRQNWKNTDNVRCYWDKPMSSYGTG